VTRVLSGAVLLAIAIGVVWFASATVFFLVAEAFLLISFGEYAALARASGTPVPEVPAALAAGFTAMAFSRIAFNVPWVSIDIVLMASLVVLGIFTLAQWKSGPHALALASAAVFPCFYLGLPIGAMIVIREVEGPKALFLLMFAVAVSDTAQYYTGRAFGRRPLAPAISPKKTIEGAIGGFIIGPMFLAVAGAWWLPEASVAMRLVMGVAVVAVGIAGDLFESMLKRSAGVKDSSHLIPGHGGILDRLDALLFAAPVYYILLKYV
jgi:phosphatidate cytidylyltransferase